MDSYNAINENYIDTFIFDTYVLVTYPCFMAFGNQYYCTENQKLAFQPKTYFKIFPYLYNEWITLFKKLMKLTVKSSETSTVYNETIICETKITLIKCIFCYNSYQFQLIHLEKNEPEILFELTLNLYQLVELFKGIQKLYFVPYMVNLDLLYVLHYIVSKFSYSDIENLNHLNVIDFVTNNIKPLKIYQNNISYVGLSYQILNHKMNILLNIRLLTYLPD